MRRLAPLFGCVVLAAAIGLFVLTLSDRLFAPDIVIEPANARAFVVSIEGAVASPGVVEVEAGARIDEVIRLAGGTTADADLSTTNRASRVYDGERIVIPTIVVHVATPGASPEAYLIDINTASTAVLDTLPGIGETLSQRIVDYREANGPYGSVEDLLEVDGISETTLDEIRDLITVGG